jgi:hypothetical protein
VLFSHCRRLLDGAWIRNRQLLHLALFEPDALRSKGHQ